MTSVLAARSATANQIACNNGRDEARDGGVTAPTLTSDATSTQGRSRAQARWLMSLRHHAPATLAIAVAAPLVGGILLVVQAGLLAKVLHQAVVEAATPSALLPLILAIAALMSGRAILIGIGEAAGVWSAEAIKLELRRSLFAHLLRQRPAWTAARASGALAGNIVDQVGAIDGFFSGYIPALVGATVLPLAFGMIVLAVEPAVGLLFLLSAPQIPVFMALIGWRAQAASQQHQQAFLRLSGFFADRLRGLVTLKLFGRAEAEIGTLRAASDDLRSRTLEVLRIAFLSSAVLELYAAVGVAGVALYVGMTYLGFVQLRSTPLTLEIGLFCLFMAPEIYLPLRQFAAHYHDRGAAKAAAEGLEDAFGTLIVTKQPEQPKPTEGRQLPRAALSVEMTGVSIRTPDGSRLVIAAMAFDAAPGTHIAVIGQSGCGKSTFLEAVAGLRAFEGRVAIDGVDIRSIAERSLRCRVAVLGQRPRLFHATIAENIRLGVPSAPHDAIEEAAARAGVMQFASAFPLGLQTRIGEGGIGLSGGEAQRVALARIYLRDPGLILLDEPTAHLDRRTESVVLDGLMEFAANRTLIVVTHSEAVAARMDRVWQVGGGRLTPWHGRAEQGGMA